MIWRAFWYIAGRWTELRVQWTLEAIDEHGIGQHRADRLQRHAARLSARAEKYFRRAGL